MSKKIGFVGWEQWAFQPKPGLKGQRKPFSRKTRARDCTGSCERLAYHEATGVLNPGDIAAADIAGTVLLRAYREYAKQSSSEHGRARARGPWLEELATKQIQWTIDRLQAVRSRGIALQQDIPEHRRKKRSPPSARKSFTSINRTKIYTSRIFSPTWSMSTPEELVAAKEELLRCVNTALAGMPIQWRRALRLRYAGELTSAQLRKCSRRTSLT